MEQESPLRAYLATALTDLPEAKREAVYTLCRRLKAECREHGVVLYLPFEHTDPHAHQSIPAPIVWRTDTRQVITSDLLFVLCVAPSYGVGGENETALSHGVPVVYLTQKGCKVSRFMLGSPTRSLTIEYESVEDLLFQFREFIPATVSALRKRREALGRPGPLAVGKRVKDLRQRMDMPVETLADLLGVGPDFVRKLEEDEDFEASLTLINIRNLAALLKASVEYLLFGATARLDERVRRSRDHLRALAREEEMLYTDYEHLWEAYLYNQKEKIGYQPIATRDSGPIIGKEQWRVWYRKVLEKCSAAELDF